uniref:Uncharacterized protein n=1 Tax=Fusarium oxysporum (strain Fo5176) TaxID=660025 RepID=A0A0D2XJG7_FUSOF
MAATNGALWRKIATAVSPAFSMGHVLGMTSIMADECLLFQEKLDELAVTGDVFSMEELIARLAFGIVSIVTLGEPQHSQAVGSQILKDLRDLVNLAGGETNPLIAYNPMEGDVPSRQNPRSTMDLLIHEHAEAMLDERKGGVYGRLELSSSEEEMIFSK